MTVLKNFCIVTVSGGYDSLAVSITLSVGDGNKLPTDMPFDVTWYDNAYANPGDDPKVEIVTVISRVGDVITVNRGQDGTSATTKNDPGKTYEMVVAINIGNIRRAFVDTTTLGIGTSSPGQDLSVVKSAPGGDVAVEIWNTDTGTGGSNARLLISQGKLGVGCKGDAFGLFTTYTQQNWAVGIDQSASGYFKISNGTALGAGDAIVITSGELVGINCTPQISPPVRLQIQHATAGEINYLWLKHTDSTSTGSHSIVRVETNGASAGNPFMQLVNTGAGTWSLGYDVINANRFAISQSAALGTSDRFIISTTGQVGIGAVPAYELHVRKDQAATTTLTVQNADNTAPAVSRLLLYTGLSGAVGDALVQFLVTGKQNWVMGEDGTTGNFVLSMSTGFGTADRIRIDTSGALALGNYAPTYQLHIQRDQAGTTTIFCGNADDAGSSRLYLWAGTTTPTGDAYVTTRTVGAANEYWSFGGDGSDGGKFKIADSTAISSSTRLTIDDSGLIGIGTTTPVADLDISKADQGGDVVEHIENTDATAGQQSDAVLWLETQGASNGDPFCLFQAAGGQDWSIGQDRSDGSKFKIANAATLPSNTRLTIDTSGAFGFNTSSPSADYDFAKDFNGQTIFYFRNPNASPGSSVLMELQVPSLSTEDIVFSFNRNTLKKYVMGIDYSDGDDFKISESAFGGSSDRMAIDGTTGGIQFRADYTGILPYTFRNDGAAATDHCSLSVMTASPGGGDPYFRWSIPTGDEWIFGLDNSDSDLLKLAHASTFGTEDLFTFHFSGYFIINQTSTADPYVYFIVQGGDSWSVGIDNSAADSFKVSKGIPGTNDYMVIETNGDVTYAASKTGTKYTTYRNSGTSSGDHSVLSVNVSAPSGGDPYLDLNIPSGAEYVIGLDNSDNDYFKICKGSVIGTDEAVRLASAQLVQIVGNYVSTAAPAAALLFNRSISWYIDETNHKLNAIIKYNDGTTIRYATLATSVTAP